MRDDAPLHGLLNIGTTIAARLKAVGVETVGDLRRIGPAEAYKRVKANYTNETLPVCYYLYSLQGALDGVRWDAVSPRKKEQLLRDAGLLRFRRRPTVRH